MSPMRRSLLDANVAVLMLGLVPLFAKVIELNAVSIIGWRALLGAAALLAFFLLRGTDLRIRSRADGLILLALGVVMALHWSAYFYAIQVSTVAIAVVSMFTWPVMAVVIEPLVYRSRVRWQDMLLGLFALTGVAFVVPEFTLGASSAQGALWGLISAVLFAVRNVAHRRWLSHYPGGISMGWQLAVVALCLMPFADVPTDHTDWGLVILLAVVFTAIAHSVLVGSMRRLKAKTVGMISCLQPFYGIVAAALVLGEVPGWRGVVGAAIVVTVAVVETVTAPAQARRDAEEAARRASSDDAARDAGR